MTDLWHSIFPYFTTLGVFSLEITDYCGPGLFQRSFFGSCFYLKICESLFIMSFNLSFHIKNCIGHNFHHNLCQRIRYLTSSNFIQEIFSSNSKHKKFILSISLFQRFVLTLFRIGWGEGGGQKDHLPVFPLQLLQLQRTN